MFTMLLKWAIVSCDEENGLENANAILIFLKQNTSILKVSAL